MKEGWEYSTIGDLCDKMNGLWKGKIGPFVNVGVIRNANFTKSFTLSFDNIEYLDVEAKQYKTRKLQKGDLIVEKSGGSEKLPVGRTVLFDKEEGEYSFSNFTSVLRIKDRTVISPEFLYKYILFVYLRGDTRKMQKATTGIHNIEFDKFLSIPVPKITLFEQQSIVDYLDSAFAKIDAMKANAEKALNEAKALFQAYLKEMLEPKDGWEEKTINDVAFFRNGIAHEKDIEDSGDYVVINSKFVATGGTIRKYSNEQLSPLYINEIVMVMSDVPKGKTLAKCYIIECNNKYSLNQRICAFKSKGLDVKFLYYLLNRNPHLLKYDNGENQTNLRKKQILECPLTFPSQKNEQQRIVICLDSLKSKVDRLQANYEKISQECDALKQAILRQVFE